MAVLMTDAGAGYCPLSLLLSASSCILDCLLQEAGGKLVRESGDFLLGLLNKLHSRIQRDRVPPYHTLPVMMAHLYPLNGL